MALPPYRTEWFRSLDWAGHLSDTEDVQRQLGNARWLPSGYDLGDFFALRVSFLVDGFNVYHSAVALSRDLGLGGHGTKWLNLASSLESTLPLIGKAAKLESIHYFSALAHHMEVTRPGTVARHERYLRCLRATDVVVHMGKFKGKPMTCPQCKQGFVRNEEKRQTSQLRSS